jgi:ketosteroid isomerase-like protein
LIVLTQEMVRAADDTRMRVMLAQDTAGMDRIMADGMIWIHAGGAVDTKASMIEKFSSDTMKYHSLDRKQLDVSIYGDCAVAYGVIELDGQVGDLRKHLTNRFMGVWCLQDGEVRLVSWQSSRTV